LGIVTTASETTFTQSAETVYDFVTNPENWTKTYPGSAHIGNLPELPLKVGDTWQEAGPDGDRIFSWQLAAAVRPTLFVFTSLGRLGHDRDDPQGLKSGLDGRITVQYRFSRPGHDVTLCPIGSFSRPTRPESMSTTKPSRASSTAHRLTPAPALPDTFAVFCNGVSR
jgi:hypothetical protein